jgi:hypothetical protein
MLTVTNTTTYSFIMGPGRTLITDAGGFFSSLCAGKVDAVV